MSLPTIAAPSSNANATTTLDATLVNVDTSSLTLVLARRCKTDARNTTEVCALNACLISSSKVAFAPSRDVWNTKIMPAPLAKKAMSLKMASASSKTVLTGLTTAAWFVMKDSTWSMENVSRKEISSSVMADRDIV